VREQLIKQKFANDEWFQTRGHEILRIEGFSDAVFAFAITLLVVSLEVPKTFDELAENIRGFGGFAAAFSILFLIWFKQYKFFRRYGLQDNVTVWLNALLLFLVLFFVYPLKFLFNMLFHLWAGGKNEVHLPNGELASIVKEGQDSQLMSIYACGYAAVFALFLLLYLRAYLKREELKLTPLETVLTLGSIREMGLQVGIGLVSLSFALVGMGAWSGMTYFLIGPLLTMQGFWTGRQRRRLIADEA
jgi:uncharacterized membrane protein